MKREGVKESERKSVCEREREGTTIHNNEQKQKTEGKKKQQQFDSENEVAK